MADLKPCPFCGSPASIVAVGRDWWRLSADHGPDCFFDDDEEATVPQDTASLEWLTHAWNGRAPDPRLAAQLRECAETLGADQIDEQRAMRAYADAIALLGALPQISRIERGDASLTEQG